jgi:hypothetical protein
MGSYLGAHVARTDDGGFTNGKHILSEQFETAGNGWRPGEFKAVLRNGILQMDLPEYTLEAVDLN